MNLPSIFKSTPAMKPSNQPSRNDRPDVPQDMFGLGIQVFKIESKKQISSGARSVGKARQEIKAIENPRKTNNIPPVPKPKKTSAILPSITKTPSEKEYRLQAITKTDSILSRKSVEKGGQQGKMEAIQEYNQPHRNAANPQKNKTFTSARAGNKSMDAVAQQEGPAQPPLKVINKEQWRDSLNVLRKFYTEASQYRNNEQSKVGRRKNQEYLGEEASFVEAYLRDNGQEVYEQGSLYDPYDIQNYRITAKSCGFEGVNYQECLPL